MKSKNIIYYILFFMLTALLLIIPGVTGCTISKGGNLSIVPSPPPPPSPTENFATLSGTVLDSSNGAPVHEATVQANDVTTVTDSDGGFKLKDIPLCGKAGITVYVTKDGFQTTSLEIDINAGETLELERAVEMITENGKIIVFTSYARLLPEDTDDKTDVYLIDLRSGQMELISVNSQGETANDHSSMGSVNVGGRYVVFRSYATNLTQGASGQSQICIRDRVERTTEILSVTQQGNPANGMSWEPRISGNGKWVVFTSWADDLTESKHRAKIAAINIYLKNLETGETTIASRTPDGNKASGDSELPSISYSGRYVTFTSNAPDLANPGSSLYQVYLYDNFNKTITPITRNTDNQWGDGNAFHSWISGDASKIVFSTEAGNMIPGMPLITFRQVYIHDIDTAEKQIISIDNNGNLGNNESFECTINHDGSLAAFRSSSSNLIPSKGNPAVPTQIFLRNIAAGTTSLVSVNNDGEASDWIAELNLISPDGKTVVFGSNSTNLVENDTNDKWDVFMRNLESNTTTRISNKSDGTQSGSDSYIYYEGLIMPF